MMFEFTKHVEATLTKNAEGLQQIKNESRQQAIGIQALERRLYCPYCHVNILILALPYWSVQHQ